MGYFETVASDEFGLWFCDYNRILGKLYEAFAPRPRVHDATAEAIKGQTGSPGIITGRVRIVRDVTQLDKDMGPTDVLVCPMTTPAYVHLMAQAGGIVTDLGGILSHAAIVARELKKPCIVGTKNATTLLKDGDLVEVHADTGVVRKLE